MSDYYELNSVYALNLIKHFSEYENNTLFFTYQQRLWSPEGN